MPWILTVIMITLCRMLVVNGVRRYDGVGTVQNIENIGSSSRWSITEARPEYVQFNTT